MMSLLVALLTFVLFMGIVAALAVLMGAAFTQMPGMIRRAFPLPEPCLDTATANAVHCRDDLERGHRDSARVFHAGKEAPGGGDDGAGGGEGGD